MSNDTEHNEHKLPMDVVRLLFDHAAALNPPHLGCGPPSHQRPSLGWITLTHVSRDWRYVGLAMPLLWASIVTTFLDPAIANEFLVRACGCLITVDIIPHLLDRDRHDKGPLYSWISEHILQVGVLKVWNPTLYDTLRHGSSETPLPLLHTIHVDDSIRRARVFITLHTLQLRSPGLRSAILTNVILPPCSTSTLRQLDLTFSGRLTASWSAIHEFLRCCTQLETLDLKATSPWSRDEEDASDVQLKKLKIARLSVDLEQTAWDIWRPVVVPDDIVLEIICERMNPALSRSTPLLLKLCATQLSAEHHDAVEFNFNSTMTVYQLSADRTSRSCTLSILSNQYGHAQLLNTFLPFIREDNIRTLILNSVSLGSAEIDDVFRVLGGALPGVTDLSLKHLNQDPTLQYIRALGRVTPAPVFPALQVLRISDLDLKGMSRNPAHYPDRRSPALYWWAMVKVALKARSGATCGALRCLVLEGKWSNAANWDMEQDGEELGECLSRGLVQEINDHRTFEKYEVLYYR